MLIRELNDIMNEYSPGWGPDTDCAPAIKRAFDNGCYRVIKNPGVHTIASQVNAGGRQIEGFGLMCSWKLDMPSGVAFQYSVPGGGMKGCSFDLAVPGDTLTYAINLSGDATIQPDQTTFEDLYITSTHGGFYWTAFQINGLARNPTHDETKGVIGVRVVTLRNIQCFQSRNYGLTILNGVSVRGDQIGIFTGRAEFPGDTLYVQDSYNVSIDGLVCSYLVRSNVNGGEIRGSFSTLS